jgi:hypothetical protein
MQRRKVGTTPNGRVSEDIGTRRVQYAMGHGGTKPVGIESGTLRAEFNTPDWIGEIPDFARKDPSPRGSSHAESDADGVQDYPTTAIAYPLHIADSNAVRRRVLCEAAVYGADSNTP